MIISLQQWAADRGYRVACGHVDILRAVRSDLAQRRTTGQVDPVFAENNLAFFRYERSSDSMAHPRAVMVVAVPRPAHRLCFELESGPFETFLPPTYLRYSAMFEDVREDILSRIPGLAGHLDILVAPLKAIACRLGLVTYGHNNVTYIPEWGSYFQLLGYITDLDIGLSPDWTPHPVRLLPECENCRACEAACPAGAITHERVLLHAEMCTTFFSETPGDLQHELCGRCLFGCLACQEICPANDGMPAIQDAGVAFDRHETEMLLAGSIVDPPADIRHKLQLLGLTEQALIGRNLRALVRRFA